MSARATRLASRFGLAGAAAGIAAGIVQATVGNRIPTWSGAKNSPVPLGVLTVALSLLAAGCAAALSRPGPGSAAARLALVLGLLLPGALCFSTVGRLWFVAGPLLLVAATVALTGGTGREYRHVLGARWPAGLVSVLGLAELVMAVSASPGVAVIGVVAGIALVVAPWLAARSAIAAAVLLAVGVVPFAVLTYWAVVPVVVAVLAVIIGAPLMTRSSTLNGRVS